jgi:26S proteasome regulatory subunit N10
MPEATMICLDSSDYMRNGDYFPSRMSGAQEACSLLIGSKMQSNPENTVGFLTMGGKACTVRETLTTDVDRVMASAASVNAGGSLHFSHGLQIAQLALSHRINRRHEARIVAFVGSPVQDDGKELEKLAKRLRKDDIAVDIIAFGVEENVEVLDRFVASVNKNNNSHFVNVPVGSSIVNSALSGFGDGTGVAQDFSEYGGVDPSMDPELAMVLRMSLEEERRRIADAAAAEQRMNQPADSAPAAAGASGAQAASPNQPAEASGAQQQQPTSSAATQNRELTEEEEIELAIKMSLGEDAPKDAPPASQQQQQQQGATDPAFAAALQDPEFMQQLRDDAKDNADDVNDAGKKK